MAGGHLEGGFAMGVGSKQTEGLLSALFLSHGPTQIQLNHTDMQFGGEL